MNNAAFGKTMKSAGKHRDINLVTTGAGRDHLVYQNQTITQQILFLKIY